LSPEEPEPEVVLDLLLDRLRKVSILFMGFESDAKDEGSPNTETNGKTGNDDQGRDTKSNPKPLPALLLFSGEVIRVSRVLLAEAACTSGSGGGDVPLFLVLLTRRQAVIGGVVPAEGRVC
jgi:hypothetical protein